MNFLDDFFDADWTPRFMNTTPAVNVKEDKKAYQMEIAVPGLRKEYCRVNLDEDNNLCIKVENKFEHKDEDSHEQYIRREFSYANYEQTFVLPDNVDKAGIEAHVADGILTVKLPKLSPKEIEKKTQTIEIQ